MKRHFSVAVLSFFVAGAVFSVGPTAGGFPNKKRPCPEAVDTPEQAVRKFVSAAQTGNLEAFLGQLATPLRRLVQSEIKIGDAEAAFQAELDKQFGKGPAPRRYFTNAAERREGIKNLKEIRILEKQTKAKDQVELTVWEIQNRSPEADQVVESRVLIVREEKGWKLFYYRVLGSAPGEWKTRKGPDGKDIEVLVEKKPQSSWDPSMETRLVEVEKLPATFEALVKDVAGGKFKSRKEAERVWQAALDTAFQQRKRD